MLEQAGYFRPHRAERIIAAGRLFLAAFLLIAILIDPAESGVQFPRLRALSVGYLTYAAAVALFAWSRRTLPTGLPISTHVVDLVLFSVFMYFSQAPVSPFFVYFIFATVCGVLRWHGRGALLTGAAALGAYVGVTIGAGLYLRWPGEFDAIRFLTRCTHLALITVLLAYLGEYQHRLQTEIANLAAWPRRLAPEPDEALREVLGHAAAILRVKRVVLAWHEGEEPSLRLAVHDRQEFASTREPPDLFDGLVAPALERSSFLCDDASGADCFVVRRVQGGFGTWRGRPLSEAFRGRYQARSVLALRIATESIDGRLIALARRPFTVDDLLLGDVVGRFVAGALEQQALIAQLREAAAGEERIRLARELHDGLLQSLTAVAMQVSRLRDLVTSDPSSAGRRLGELEETILAEQRGLRAVVNELKPERQLDHLERDPAARIRDVVTIVARQWNVGVRLDLSQDVPPLPRRIVHECCRMAQEAVVNAIRHGGAAEVEVGWSGSRERLTLVVAYKGRGFGSIQGRHDLASLDAMRAGPRTLKERVTVLGGDLVIESDGSGARLEIGVPLRG